MFSPLSFGSYKGTLIEDGSDERVHLGHVTAQPKNPTANTHQHEAELRNDPILSPSCRDKLWQHASNYSEESGEQNQRSPACSHTVQTSGQNAYPESGVKAWRLRENTFNRVD